VQKLIFSVHKVCFEFALGCGPKLGFAISFSFAKCARFINKENGL